jgi:glycosyltransferase involved in cell wall biosynthesis
MHEHDVVVVPSRHEYPEGLPNTIYEALCSRTPIVASDHPMFALKLRDGENSAIFPAGDARALAERIRALVDDRELYERLSGNSEQAAATFQVPLKWHELLDRWLRDAPGDHDALARFTLANGGYGV